MLRASRVDGLMTPGRKGRLAAALWLILAFLVWNVVFDRTLVLAGRRYSYAAVVAMREQHAYLHIDDWMRPAIARGATMASFAAGAVAAIGLAAVAVATRRQRRQRGQ